MNPKDKPWTIGEEMRLRREFPYKTNAELARAFGRSQQALCVKASKMGLKKDHYGIVWTQLQLDTLRRLFPTMFNADLTKLLGVSRRTMIRKARPRRDPRDKAQKKRSTQMDMAAEK